MTLLINGIFLLIAIALLGGYVRRTVTLLPVLVFVLYQHLWLLISSAYVEQGVYLTDTQRVTYFDGATIRLLLLLVAFFLGSLLALKLAERYGWTKLDDAWDFESASERFNKAFYYLAMLVCLSLSAVLAVNLMLSGTILTNSSITRFNFYTTYSAIGIAQYISYVQAPMCLFVGMVVVYRRSGLSRVLAACVFFFQVVYLWLIGNEATAFMVNTLFFILPWLGKVLSSNKLNSRALRHSVIACFLLVLGVLAVKYFSTLNTSIYGAESEDSFTYRLLALQSNTWWNVDRLVWEGGGSDPGQWFTEMGQLFGAADSSEAGIWYLMQLIMPKAEYARYVLGNGTLNAGYPAINIAIFGYGGGVFVTFLDGFVFMFASIYFYRKVSNGQFFCACMAALVYKQLVSMYTMGGVGYLFNLLPMVCMFLLAYWELLSYASRREHRVALLRGGVVFERLLAWVFRCPRPLQLGMPSGWTGGTLCPSI